MPELIAILHSFVGLAAVLVGYNSFLTEPADPAHLVEVFLGVLIGAVTFTGSIVAYLKLSTRISSAPLVLPGRNWLNLGMVVASGALLAWFLGTGERAGPLLLMTVVALALGWHLVASIGGGDMPVVVSMLNSYSGWAAAAAGFMLSNDLLIVTGALVGSSGAILSYLMCTAMNRSFVSVILGGYGTGGGTVVGGRRRARRVPRDQAARGRGAARRRPPRRHHARVRHGRRQGAVPGRGARRPSCAPAASRSGSACTPSRAGCPGT